MRSISIILFLFLGLALRAQDTMSYDEFIQRVTEHHPVARAANIQIEKGEAILLQSRGAFDPKLISDISRKYFDGENYYTLAQGGLKVPTWFGLELQAGFDQSSGTYLNPEATTPGSGLYNAGLNLTLGQGLFIDKRRAELKKARLYLEASAFEQQLILNQLIFDASKAYWKWYIATQELEIYQNAMVAVNERYDAVKQSYILGDLPAIDTLESGIQVQNRSISLKEAELALLTAKQMLQIYLWDEGLIPLILDEEMIPSPLSISESTGIGISALDSLIVQHPALNKYELEIDQLEIEERWKREQLKPDLNLKYNFLNESLGAGQFNPNNYVFGMSFEMPVLLRKERGELQWIGLEIEQQSLGLELSRTQYQNKVIAALAALNTTDEQLVISERIVEDYEDLWNGERQKFDAGESSLFLVNSRELGYIGVQLKYLQLFYDNKVAQLNLLYNLGLLGQ